MADPKPQRQVAAKQEHAAKSRWEKRPEDMDAEAAPSDGAHADARHVADAAPVAESTPEAQAPAAAPSATASSGPSFGLIGAGAAGVLGLIAAAAGGGGGSKSSDVTPPVVNAPQPEQPKPVDPKTPDPKPAEPTTPQTQEPSHPDTTTSPTQPTTPDQTPPPSQPDTTTTQPTTPDHTTPPATPDQTPPPSQPDTTPTQPTTPDHTTPPATPDQTQQPSQPDTTTTQPTTPDHTTPPATPDQTQQPSQPDTTTPPSTPDQPKQPDLPKLEVKLTVDSGYSDSDHLTNQAGVTVSGLQSTDTWRYSTDGGTTWTDRSGSDGVIDASAFSAGDGDKSILVQRTANGSAIGDSEVFNFSLDTTPLSEEEIQRAFNFLDWTLQDGRPVYDLNFDPKVTVNYLVASNGRGTVKWSDPDWSSVSGDGVVDLLKGLSQPLSDAVTLYVAVEDAAGNITRRGWGDGSSASPYHYFINLLKTPSQPSVALKVDTGMSGNDLITANPELKVSAGIWVKALKYSLDEGVTWKDGEEGFTWTIAGPEVGFSEGVKHIQVKTINYNDKESPITYFDFTLKADDILGTAPNNPGEPTTFTGTAGIDHFVVKPQDGAHIQIQGFNADQNDVIDLRQVLSIPAGAKIEDFIGTMYSANGSHSFNVHPTGDPLAQDKDLEISIPGDSAPGSPTTVLYDGGQITLLTSNLPEPAKLAVKLVTDSGDSDSDRITNDATVEVSGLLKGDRWLYKLDQGNSWYRGTDDHRIPAEEFKGIEGARLVTVNKVGDQDVFIDSAELSFTLKADDIHAAPPDSNGVAHFTGTSGIDHFVVKPTDGLRVSIQDLNADQGDVIDLSQVLSIPAGANVKDYVGGMSQDSGAHFFFVNQSGDVNTGGAANIDKLLLIRISGDYVPGSHTTVIYDGGKVVI